jgi:hypothetical protein
MGSAEKPKPKPSTIRPGCRPGNSIFPGGSKDMQGIIHFGNYRFSVARLMLFMAVSLSVLMLYSVAFAIVAPAAGTFAYDVYDVAVTKMLQGPIGFVGGVAAMIIGAVLAIQGKIMGAIPAICGGAVLLKADALVTSLGAII